MIMICIFWYQVIDVHRFIWHKTNENAPGFSAFFYDIEEIVVGYFREDMELEHGDPKPKRPVSLFNFKDSKQRSSVWSFPRGHPYRDPSDMTVHISSVWNLDMLLQFFETCLEPGDTLCDMFAGTATAAIAALYRGCHVHIVEKRSQHLSACRKRINGYMNTVSNNQFKFNQVDDEAKENLMPNDVIVHYIVIILIIYILSGDILLSLWKTAKQRQKWTGRRGQ